jgi:hypothetical protein
MFDEMCSPIKFYRKPLNSMSNCNVVSQF